MKTSTLLTKRTAAAMTLMAVIAIPAIAWAAGAPTEETAQFANKSLIGKYLAAFGAGVVTALTPCVYPMIPIVVGVFGARKENTSKRRGAALGGMYVLGMGLLFAALGATFAALGNTLGMSSLLANPAVAISLVAFYGLLAASMFGAFELRLPYALQNRLNQVGGEGYAGAFGLGMVGALTAAPCTGPILIAILAYIATTGGVFFGATLLFVYALGVGTLFMVIAIFSVSLPKSGGWMEWVKNFGGVALLIVGFYILTFAFPQLSRLGNPATWFVAVCAAAIVGGIILGAIHKPFSRRLVPLLRKSMAVALVVIGSAGAINWYYWSKLDWVYNEDKAYALALTQGKGVMVDFGASWCTPCRQIEKIMGEDSIEPVIVSNFVPLKFDVSEDSPKDQALYEKYKTAGQLPSVIFLTAQGREVARYQAKAPSAQSFTTTLTGAIDKLKTSVATTKSEPGHNEDKAATTTAAKTPAAQLSAPTAITKPQMVTSIGPATTPKATPSPPPPHSSPREPPTAPAIKTPSEAVTSSAAKPPANPSVTPTTQKPKPPVNTWFSSESAAFSEAKRTNRGVVVDFSATWCAPCQDYDKKTFKDGKVLAELTKSFVLLKFDVSADTPSDQAKAKRYRVKEYPAIIFVDINKRELVRVDEFLPPAKFLPVVKRAAAKLRAQ